jgi:hypothetical protein
MFDFRPRTGGWPYSWPVGARVIEARPLAVRVEEAARLSGLPYADLIAFHERGKLPFIELGPVQLVLVRDLESLIAELPRSGEPPAPPKRRRGHRHRTPTAAAYSSRKPEPTAA